MKENRRDFLKKVALPGLILPFAINCTMAQKTGSKNDCDWCKEFGAPLDVSYQATLAGEKDEGEPLIISGTVFENDGKTPAPNVLIYVYHTDNKGYYGRGNGDHPHGKHRGWLLTNEKGQYEFRTVKPGIYPLRDTPAHIHYTLYGKNLKSDWIDDVWFSDDELLTPELKKRLLSGKGGFNPILTLEKGKDGILRGVRDIKLWERKK